VSGSHETGFGLGHRLLSPHSRVSVAQYGNNLSRMASIVNGVQAAQSIVSLANVDPTDFSRPMARQDVLLSQVRRLQRVRRILYSTPSGICPSTRRRRGT